MEEASREATKPSMERYSLHLPVGAGAHPQGPPNSAKTQWDLEVFCPIMKMDPEPAFFMSEVQGALITSHLLGFLRRFHDTDSQFWQDSA